MNRLQVILLAMGVILPMPLLADGDAQVRRTYSGVWAGKRMPCTAPDDRLHVYSKSRTSHPAVFDDYPGYACAVQSMSGRWPQWTLRLICRSHQINQPPVMLRTTQTLTLTDGGRWLRMKMVSDRGDELWSDDMIWCRSLRPKNPKRGPP